MKMSSSMKKRFAELGSERTLDTIWLHSKLLSLLKFGFTQERGAVLLQTQKRLSKEIGPNNFPDLTGYECFINHVHIEDHVDNGISSNDILKHGLAFAQKMAEELRSSFPGERFKVIVAINESGCSVRFHRIRDGENWLPDNIEEYPESILILETPE